MTDLTAHYIEHLISRINQLSHNLAVIQPNSSQARTLAEDAERNLVMLSEMLVADITCIGCGCTGEVQCTTKDGWGCYWLVVDYEKKKGVCSKCTQVLSAWLEESNENRPTNDSEVQRE